jgi:type IV pilus assembly protein PilE
MSKQQARHNMGGFTLLEVMTVVIIVGVLTAVALPMYEGVMQKGRRADAMRDLMEMASRQERFYAQNSRYTKDVGTAAGLNMNRDEESQGVTLSGDGYYTLTATEGATGSINTSFELSAAPRGPQAKDTKCGTFILNSVGVRGVSGDLENCW